MVSVIVPRRLRTDWRREWEAELEHQEVRSSGWRTFDRRRWVLVGQSLGSCWDALALQRRRLEEDFVQDVRHGVRLAWRSPGLAIAACASIAVGIGGLTAAFSLVDAALLHRWPYPHAERLVVLRTDLGQYFSAPAFRRLLEGRLGIDHLTATQARDFVVDVAGQAMLFKGHRISRGALPLLGLEGPLHPTPGRPFRESEFALAGEPVLLISHRLWQAQFGSAPDVIGRRVNVDGGFAQVVGVLPRQFDFFQNADILAPLTLSGPRDYDEFDRTLEVFGSLRPGMQLAEADWLLTSVTRHFRPSQVATVEAVRDRLFNGFRPTLRVLTLVSFLILAACCINFATLLAVRSSDRRQELAVRVALGAGRERIIRQLVTEALVLSTVGGVAGVLAAHVLRGVFAASGGAGALSLAATLDWRVASFAVLLIICTGFICSIGPARHATAALDVEAGLKGGAGVRLPVAGAARGLAASIQLGLTITLLMSAGLLVKSLGRIQAFDPGYDSKGAVSLRFDLPRVRYRTDADVARFVDAMTNRLASLSGVELVGATSSLPYTAGALQMRMVTFEVPVHTSTPPEPMPFGWVVPPPPPPPPGMPPGVMVEHYPALSCEVGPGFFRTMRVPLLMGREFSASDTVTSTPVILINRAMAERYWSGENPVGRRVRLGPLYPWKAIVGVVDNIRRFARDDAARSEYYEPFTQAGDQRRVVEQLTGRQWLGLQAALSSEVLFVVRTDRDVPTVVGAATAATRDIDPALPIAHVSTLRNALDDAIADRRFLRGQVAGLAGLALVLAAVGIHAVTSQAVRGRARELAVRAALGARAGHLIWLAIGSALRTARIGGVFGVLISTLLTPQLGPFLYQVSPWDAGTFLSAVLILLPVVISAAYIPARRAGRVDPVSALKSA